MPLLKQKKMADARLDKEGNPVVNARGKVLKVKRRKIVYDLACVKQETDAQLNLIGGSGQSLSEQSTNTPSTLTSRSDSSMTTMICAKLKDYFENGGDPITSACDFSMIVNDDVNEHLETQSNLPPMPPLVPPLMNDVVQERDRVDIGKII